MEQSSDRQELLQNAVLFLNDPKVQSSSLISRIQFLESKGLTEPEIQQALNQAAGEPSVQAAGLGIGSGSGNAPPERPRDPAPRYGYQQAYAVAPEPPRRDWRDLFIMAMVSGGVVYGITALARKYLVPHLRPPSTTAFQETSTSLTSQYDEATRLLGELQSETTKLQTNIEADKERVNTVVGDVEDALQSLRDGEERWRGEMRDIRGEVESVRELVPKMIEKHAQSQSTALADLQSEIRSLKTLLASRQAAISSPSGSNGNLPSHSGTGQNVSTPTTHAANALLGPRAGRASIPAWQMAPTSSASAGGASSPGGRVSPAKEETDKEAVGSE
ncbi:hypothetical protein L202_04906 [Cryptococcus amylolentus CBS 6039]|uniref:Peroxisomal membrane protein PEX14 n=1 Tax=Cryptococcus amylolentus CBS 6039 TaxID=1295533 RepID=A0A1E3HPY3_9TREE|nr:hypothetical protein L202_04906 [Cryptococcus amylolentus CBS 6039]ODN77776.1 hypothetical protein L202_04906 [Cryptococcus amylolentus CBS 6039]